MRARSLLGVLLTSFALTAAHAVPTDYTFTVNNVTQRVLDVTGPDLNNPVELPLGEPAYSGPVSITGSFTYDPDITGRFSAPVGAEVTAAEVLYPDAISNFIVTVNGENYSRDRSITIFIDETTTEQGAYYRGDALRTLSAFGTILETFTLTHNGIEYEARTPGFILTEGLQDGYNFFPDAALADTACNFCESSAALPVNLPPAGTTDHAFYLTFVDNPGGNTTRNYQLLGDIEITPVVPLPPEPLPGPAEYKIHIDVTDHKFFDPEGNELDLANPPIAGGDIIDGRFAYDASLGADPFATAFVCRNPLCIATSSNFGSPTDFQLNLAGQTYSSLLTLMLLMVDETGYTGPEDPYAPWGAQYISEPQDYLSLNKAPISIGAPNVAIVHDGLTYQVIGFQLNYFEGDTGQDFFPDTDPHPDFPVKLPPEGAEFGTALIWLRAVDQVGATIRELSVFGDLRITGPVIPVSIDIDPWSAGNEVLPNSDNPIAVGVLSSSTVNGDAVDFDTSKINPATLQLGAAGTTNALFPWVQDFNSDYNNDVAYGFKTQATGIVCNDTEVALSGETWNGQPFEGTGTIDATDCVTGSCHPL